LEQFDSVTEATYGVLWDVALETHARYQQYGYELLVNELRNQLNAAPTTLSEQEREDLLHPDTDGILYGIMFTEENQLVPTYGQELLRRFLKERSIVRPLRKALLDHGHTGSYPTELLDIVQEATRRASRIESLSTLPAHVALPERGDIKIEPQIFIPTTINWVDGWIRGQRPGDANGLLGAYGAGKTTAMFQLAVANARHEAAETLAVGKRPRLSVILNYEEPRSKYERKIWSAATNIAHPRLANLTDWSSLSSIHRGNLQDYELRLPENSGQSGPVRGEMERWDDAMSWLNMSLVVCDMSGSEAYHDAGKGYVDEICRVLERLMDRFQTGLRCVTIDYAGLVCRRHLVSKNINEDRLRHFLGNFGDLCRTRVSEPYQCTTWVAHQLSADANKKSPTSPVHFTDSAEARNFAENLAVCGCIGARDRATNCTLLNWDKVRYAEQLSTYPILKINGDFCRLDDVSHRYSVDSSARRFLTADDANQIVGATVAADTAPPPRRSLLNRTTVND